MLFRSTQNGIMFDGVPLNKNALYQLPRESVRYITRANERYLVRAKLYQQAVDLLGAKPASPT